MLLGLGAALLAAVFFGFGAIMQAIGARRVPATKGLNPRLLLRLLHEPAFLAAIGLNLSGFVLHLVSLRLIPLYLAQAGIAASLAVTALLAVRFRHDHLGSRDWWAVASVSVGLAMLAVASGPIGDQPSSGAFVVGLFIVLGAVALLGALATRMRHGLGASLLGMLAGFGFAGSGISARILPGLSPADLWDAPATYALPTCGGLAFLLYSLALQRGTVTAATAPMIVAQTVIPATVGVILLDDEFRAGWLPLAALGLLLSLIGAILLARFEGALKKSG